jgi:hypothetical protein
MQTFSLLTGLLLAAAFESDRRTSPGVFHFYDMRY